MRIVSFALGDRSTYGFVQGARVVPRDSVSTDLPESITALIASSLQMRPLDLAGCASIPIDELHLLAPLADCKVICAGVNYGSHRSEAAIDAERPEYPTIFTRYPDSLVGPGEDIVLPDVCAAFDYEGELAVVIGKSAWRVPEEKAMDHVFGYSCFNDGTARDWQRHSSQWTLGKNFSRSGSMGPQIVTCDEVLSIAQSRLTTRVNGDLRQSARVGDMLFSIAELVAYVSSVTPLSPGDVLATGTPAGVGAFMEPPTMLEPGDVVEVEIEGVGLLVNKVVAETSADSGADPRLVSEISRAE